MKRKPGGKLFIRKTNDLSNNFPFFRDAHKPENVAYSAHLAIRQEEGGAPQST